MNSKYSYLLLTISLFVFSCKGQSQEITTKGVEIQEQLFDSTALLDRVKHLSSDALEGRKTGTEGGLLAREYVIDEFKKHDVAPLLNDYTQSFTFIGRRNNSSHKGANILGVIKGTIQPEKYIVISAHYDHVGKIDGKIYNGADDDASGTSALLAFAEYFKNHPPKNSVILAAFDAEEMGLRGAYHFVEQAQKDSLAIKMNINMDMIGRNDNNELYMVGLNQYKQLKPIIQDLKLPKNIRLLSGHDGTDDKQNWMSSSDHAAFHKADIPFLYFGVEDHPDYHKPTDDFERIQPAFYVKAVITIISIFEKIDDMSQ